jgi:hypothetical protein
MENGIRLLSDDDSTIGPDRIVIDPNQIANETISVAIGTTIGVAINRLLQ